MLRQHPSGAIHEDLEALCQQYDGFLLDLWGVVMDGVSAFPGALAWLNQRRMEQKPIWFLSNASRTRQATAQLLANLGIAAELYAGLTTSGQLAIDALTDANRRFAPGLIHVIGEMPALNGWPAAITDRFTDDLQTARLILALGSFPAEELAERFAPLLQALDKPLLCANPDRELIFGGKPLFGAGMLAQRFAEVGGMVYWFGKPDPAAFIAGWRELQRLGVQKVLFVGDSMVTDIPGARQAGLESLLLTSTGIHRAELAVEFNQSPSPERLSSFLAQYAIQPDFVAAGLR